MYDPLFDIAATGRVEIGMTTLKGSEDFEELVELSAPGKLCSYNVAINARANSRVHFFTFCIIASAIL